MSFRVVKLGGSLLDLPDLPARFTDWLARQPPRANVLIVGGGRLADEIRAADRLHGLSAAAAHRLCLDAMGLTARLVCELLPGSRLCLQAAELVCNPAAGLQILDVRELLAAPLAAAIPLPESWQVTSDSIAACAARALGATELVLLKSARQPLPVQDWAALAALGYVDEFFAAAVGALDVRVVDLRTAGSANRRAGIAGAGRKTSSPGTPSLGLSEA